MARAKNEIAGIGGGVHVSRMALALALSAVLHAALIYGIAGDRRNLAPGAEKKSVIEVSISEISASGTSRPAISAPGQEKASIASPSRMPDRTSLPLPPQVAGRDHTDPSISDSKKNTGEGEATAVNTARATVAATDTVTTPAKALTPISPAYPAAALASSIEGRVTAQLLIDEAGAVVDSSVVNAEPVGHFEASALKALRSARFSPATRNGVAVKSEKLIVVTYRLE